MKVGYERVSTKEQNLARQDELMKSLGVEKVFADKLSGKDTERPQLKEMLNFVREGDTVIVESISRFARNTKDLLELIEQLNAKGVTFISQKENIDFSNSSGRFMLEVFGAMAELERSYIRERQREGIEIAKQEGHYNGRPQKQLDGFVELYADWKAKKISATRICRQLGISRSTFYRRVREMESNIINFG